MRRRLLGSTALIALAAVFVLGIPLVLVEAARVRQDTTVSVDGVAGPTVTQLFLVDPNNATGDSQVLEARDASGAEFGDSRIEASVRRAATLPAPALVDALATDLAAFCGRESPEDDVTIAAIRNVATR